MINFLIFYPILIKFASKYMVCQDFLFLDAVFSNRLFPFIQESNAKDSILWVCRIVGLTINYSYKKVKAYHLE